MLLGLCFLYLFSSTFTLVTAQIGRWGASAVLLTPSNPTLFIISGKEFVAGQTFDSTPITSTSLYLDLSQPFSPAQLAAPNFTRFEGPNSFLGSVVPLSKTQALLFGGDGTGNSMVQTGFDSVWTLNATASPKFTQETTVQPYGTNSEPMRRESSYSTSVTSKSSGITAVFIYGGVKADGSNEVLNEIWILELNSGGVIGNGWNQINAVNGPSIGMYGGVAVLVGPKIYIIGGVAGTGLASLSTIYIFDISTFTWSKITVPNAPSGRTGLIAVYTGNNEIFIQGGRDLNGNIYSSAFILSLDSNSWRESSAIGIGAVYDHVGILLGNEIIITLGYGANSPASSALIIYSIPTDTYLNQYNPSYAQPLISGASGSVNANPSAATNIIGSNNPANTIGSLGSNSILTPANPLGINSNPLIANPASPTVTGNVVAANPTFFLPGGPQPTPNSNPNSNSNPNLPNSSPESPTSTSSPIPVTNYPPAQPKTLIAILSALGGVFLIVIGLYLAHKRKQKEAKRARLRGDGSIGRWIGITFPSKAPDSEKGKFVGDETTERASRRDSGVRAISLSELWARRDSREGTSYRARRDMLGDENVGWSVFDQQEGEAAIGLLANESSNGGNSNISNPRRILRRVEALDSGRYAPVNEQDNYITAAVEAYRGGSFDNFTHLEISSDSYDGEDDAGLLSPIEEEFDQSEESSGESEGNDRPQLFGSFQPATLPSADSHTSEESGASLQTGGGRPSLRRSSTWWQRLNPLYAFNSESNPTPIRDPTHPSFAPIYNDLVSVPERLVIESEQGGYSRSRSEGHQKSLSGSDGTASSSMVTEERMRTMDIARSASRGSYRSYAGSEDFNFDGDGSGILGEWSNAVETPQIIRRESIGRRTRTGPGTLKISTENLSMSDLSEKSESPNLFVTPRRDLLSAGFPLPPPRAVSPSSPSGKILSIRNSEIIRSNSDGSLHSTDHSSSGHSAPARASGSGVQAIIQRFETQIPARLVNLDSYLAPIKESPESSKSKSSPGSSSGGGKRGSEIVRKPVLFLANPDEDEEEEK